MCRHLFVYVALILILSSCNRHSKVDIRKPFEVSHKLSCEGLIENGYTRLWGDDVVLVSKEVGDTLVYYQLEYEQEEIELEVNFINGDDVLTIIPEGATEFYEKLCEDAYVYFRHFKLKLDKDKNKALQYLKSIDATCFKRISNNGLYVREGEYFSVLNLKTQDTFNCSITKEKGYWYFQSSITLKNSK